MTFLTEPHWEHNSHGEGHAELFSIWMKLVPLDTDGSPMKLEREMMYFAILEYCALVAVYGAMDGEVEYWAWGMRMAVVVVHIWPWPFGEGWVKTS